MCTVGSQYVVTLVSVPEHVQCFMMLELYFEIEPHLRCITATPSDGISHFHLPWRIMLPGHWMGTAVVGTLQSCLLSVMALGGGSLSWPLQP